jgi:hypothetical protein
MRNKLKQEVEVTLIEKLKSAENDRQKADINTKIIEIEHKYDILNNTMNRLVKHGTSFKGYWTDVKFLADLSREMDLQFENWKVR